MYQLGETRGWGYKILSPEDLFQGGQHSTSQRYRFFTSFRLCAIRDSVCVYS
jgi:hypothetical protein